MNINLSDSVVSQVLKLQAIEEWRLGNYIRIDEKINKLRYLVSELVLASVLREIRTQQFNPPVEWKTNSNPDTI